MRRIQRKTLKKFETGVAPETRRIDKITGPTAPLLQVRACGGYGRPAQTVRKAFEEDQ
jgi:hypothetical protein